MADTINQNQLAQCLILLKFIYYYFFRKFYLAYCNFIFFNVVGINMFSGIYIDFIGYILYNSRYTLCSEFYKIFFSNGKFIIIHPEQCHSNIFCGREVFVIGKNTSSADIHFFVQLNGYRTSCTSFPCLFITYQNCLYRSCFIARQCCDGLSCMNMTTLDLSLESTEFMIRTAHTLYRHIEYGIFFCF